MQVFHIIVLDAKADNRLTQSVDQNIRLRTLQENRIKAYLPVQFLISIALIFATFLRLDFIVARVRIVVSGSCIRSLYLPQWFSSTGKRPPESPQGSMEFVC